MGAVEADTVGETKPGHGKVVVGHAPPVPPNRCDTDGQNA